MKFQMTLLVFKKGVRQGELDVIAQYPDATAALEAVIQLGAANSLLYHHPDVKALLKDVPLSALARIHESMEPGTVVLLKSIAQCKEVMPEELRTSPHAFHIMASRPKRKIPREGIIETLHDGQVQ